uniref:Uncharacterized protein n=1 Tax=Anopheles funestus TaxID=62324 RepID=A0A182S197_ANOFN
MASSSTNTLCIANIVLLFVLQYCMLTIIFLSILWFRDSFSQYDRFIHAILNLQFVLLFYIDGMECLNFLYQL